MENPIGEVPDLVPFVFLRSKKEKALTFNSYHLIFNIGTRNLKNFSNQNSFIRDKSRYIKYFFFLLFLLLPLYISDVKCEFQSQHLFSFQSIKDTYSNIHYTSGNLFSGELGDHSHCKISSASLQKDFFQFQNNLEKIFFWANNDSVKINNFHLHDLFIHKSILTYYYSDIPILLQKESFLI